MASKKRLKPKFKRIIRLILLLFILVGAWGAYWAYGEYTYRYSAVVVSKGTVQFYSGTTIGEAADNMAQQGIIASADQMKKVAKERGVENVKAGNYSFDKSDSYRMILSRLLLGRETPVRVTFNNIRTLEQLSGVVSKRMMADSLEFLEYFRVDAQNSTKEDYIAYFIPNTYELYWSESPEKFSERMKAEYQKFWSNPERSNNAQRLGFSPTEIITIASIVDEETNKESEMTDIAGVYINRLRRSIPLQADPTVKFAMGDFTLKRILNKHLSYPSPYNTYLNAGLPPGPICAPSIAAIQATLNYADNAHNYIYFCAKSDLSGYHAFASTLSQHNANARAYHQELNRRKIR